MKTITLDDDTFAKLLAAFGAAPATPGTNTPPPVVTPPPVQVPDVKIVELPWRSTSGRNIAIVPAGEHGVAFRLDIPAGVDTKGGTCDFTQSPTGDDDYYFRQMVLSDKPGDFTGSGIAEAAFAGMQKQNTDLRLRFAVGSPVMRGIVFKSPDPSIAVLQAGRTWYVNVRQIDPKLSCTIDYTLSIPGA